MFLSSVSKVLGHDSWLPIKDRAHSAMKLLLRMNESVVNSVNVGRVYAESLHRSMMETHECGR